MKIKNIVVTFWFEKYDNTKGIFEELNSKLTEYFPAFNYMGLPANVDPIVPRINSQSKSGHTIFNMSTINVQITTNYDGNFNEDFSKCIDYMEERASKIYNLLISKEVKVLYSAVFVNLEKEVDNPIQTIQQNLLSSSVNENTFSEVGMRASMVIDNKYYRILTINNSKDFTMQKQITPGQNTIIFPLISLNDATITKEYISISYELNDKYSFDSNENYTNNTEIIKNMFLTVRDDLQNKIEVFVNTGKIN